MDPGRKSITRASRQLLSSLLLLLAVALSAANMPQAAVRAATPRAQAALLRLAQRQPGLPISVIVQKQGPQRTAEHLATALGGRITLDLQIINAFAAEMPAYAAVRLAESEAVRWVSLNSRTIASTASASTCSECISTTNLSNAYVRSVGADKLWNSAPYLQGQGVTVAVVDSGVKGDHGDFDWGRRVLTNVKSNSGTTHADDGYGHGTHVAGIIGGNGLRSSGTYIGIAPKINLINVKVSDDHGVATAADVVNGLQWIYNNRSTYNIRVVNLSLNSALYESYHNDPLCAAAEILWFNGIVVVVSAGNNGKNALYPPANDPFVITVGAVNDQGTAAIGDDRLATFSGFGLTGDGFAKPDLVAPGSNIIAPLASASSKLAQAHPGNIVKYNNDKLYFRMSGTSMSAPIVAAAAALLLQDEPLLTPDQVKYRLKHSATRDLAVWPAYSTVEAGAGYLNIYAAVQATTSESANTGIKVSSLLTTGSDPVTYESSTWGSVNWGSVNWGSVNWGSVNWGSVNWGSDHWDN